METAGELVASILWLTGWTQARLVLELRRTARSLGEVEPAGLDAVTVNRWIRGRQHASGYYLRLLRRLRDSVQQASPEPGWPHLGTGAIDGERERVRHRFLAHAALAGVGAMGLDRLDGVLQGDRAIDARLVTSLELLTRGLGRRWHSTSPPLLLSVVRQCLAVLTELRLSVGSPTLERHVRRVHGGTAALAGWLTWLTGERATAEAFYALAHTLGVEAGDDETVAFVLVARSFLYSPLFRAGHTAHPLPASLLDEAVDVAGRTSSPLLRVFALARHAEEHAAGRAPDAASIVRRDLDRMDLAFSTVPERDGGFFSYWDGERLAGIRGTCAVLLGESGEAIDILTSALAATPPELAAERSILLTDLAAAHAQRAEVERACELLGRSISVGSAGDINRLGRILDVRRTYLERWARAPAVRELDDRLRARLVELRDERPAR